MCNKYRLGLSRNRLFEFDSTAVFCGKFKSAPEESEVQKALSMLSCKVPAITSKVELLGDADAFIVTGCVQVKAEFSSFTADEIVHLYEQNSLRFCDKLFEFKVSEDGYLVIAGHTVFCDAKSLLRLASYFAGFYSKTELSVEPEEILTFSEPKSLPVDVISPLVNKLSSELDDSWQKNARTYTQDDYVKARSNYLKKRKEVGKVQFNLLSGDVAIIRDKCLESEIDFSSVVCFAFYKAIKGTVKTNRKSSKIRVWADRRYFHGGNNNYSVGAYSGTVTINLTKKEFRKTEAEQLKLFHTDLYRAVTSPFRVFSDDVMLSNVENSFCDSSYMYMAGENKFKSSKNLAETYGCMNEELCEFFYCNLTQRFWNGLDFYENVLVREPFKPCRSPFSVSVVENTRDCFCELRYDTSRVNENEVKEILKKVEKYLLELKK